MCVTNEGILPHYHVPLNVELVVSTVLYENGKQYLTLHGLEERLEFKNGSQRYTPIYKAACFRRILPDRTPLHVGDRVMRVGTLAGRQDVPVPRMLGTYTISQANQEVGLVCIEGYECPDMDQTTGELQPQAYPMDVFLPVVELVSANCIIRHFGARIPLTRSLMN